MSIEKRLNKLEDQTPALQPLVFVRWHDETTYHSGPFNMPTVDATAVLTQDQVDALEAAGHDVTVLHVSYTDHWRQGE